METAAQTIQRRLRVNRYQTSEKGLQTAWESRLKARGLTPATYLTLLKAQNYKCAICRNPLKKYKRSFGHLDLDHDHATGATRGLLCVPCNSALGQLRDRIDLCQAAAEYLKQYA